MKHLMASVTIGACLLIPSAGVVFAVDPHNGIGGNPPQTGQPGTGVGAGAQCGVTGLTPPPGQMKNSSVNSPFNDSSKAYAGTTNPNANSPHAVAQYDVACFQPH